MFKEVPIINTINMQHDGHGGRGSAARPGSASRVPICRARHRSAAAKRVGRRRGPAGLQ